VEGLEGWRERVRVGSGAGCVSVKLLNALSHCQLLFLFPSLTLVSMKRISAECSFSLSVCLCICLSLSLSLSRKRITAECSLVVHTETAKKIRPPSLSRARALSRVRALSCPTCLLHDGIQMKVVCSKVVCTEYVLYRICSLTNVFSIECVLFAACLEHHATSV